MTLDPEDLRLAVYRDLARTGRAPTTTELASRLDLSGPRFATASTRSRRHATSSWTRMNGCSWRTRSRRSRSASRSWAARHSGGAAARGTRSPFPICLRTNARCSYRRAVQPAAGRSRGSSGAMRRRRARRLPTSSSRSSIFGTTSCTPAATSACSADRRAWTSWLADTGQRARLPHGSRHPVAVGQPLVRGPPRARLHPSRAVGGCRLLPERWASRARSGGWTTTSGGTTDRRHRPRHHTVGDSLAPHARATTLTRSGLPKQNVAGSNPVSRSTPSFMRGRA